MTDIASYALNIKLWAEESFYQKPLSQQFGQFDKVIDTHALRAKLENR